jgi:hypothetical protein
MTTTSFYIPTSFDQVQTVSDATGYVSLPWENAVTVTPNNPTYTANGLHTISGMWFEKYLSYTNQLWCTNFNIPTLSGDILGVELEIFVERAARIQDSVIQLAYNGELIGDNHAILAPIVTDINTGNTISPIQTQDYHIYGAADNTWGYSLTPEIVSDPSFGVVVAFGSNPTIPHRDIPYLSQVGLRITYA